MWVKLPKNYPHDVVGDIYLLDENDFSAGRAYRFYFPNPSIGAVIFTTMGSPSRSDVGAIITLVSPSCRPWLINCYFLYGIK
jgi:hypothetical protein